MYKIPLKQIFGENVREERLRQGITQAELAERSGLDETYIQQIETKYRNVSLKTVSKITAGLLMPAHVLLTEREIEWI